jgi:class 3 adenylate cyclase/tetratricopeptide (TPR) repeat protein
MPSPQIERKLAAIMFTDIAGYTALSAKDSTKASELLTTQRETLKPIVEKHGGSWMKEIGDGLLLTFDSATSAVECSIAIQEATKNIEDLNLRIGIHEGEVIKQDGDVIGDDVNVASRIEPFSAIGGVAISQKVQQAISSNQEFDTKYVGKPKLKGVAQEVKVYCINSHGLPETDISKVSAKLEEESKFNIFALTGGILTAIGIAFWIAVGVFDVSFGGKVEVPSVGILMMENRGVEEDEFWASSFTEDLIIKVASAPGLIRVTPMKEILEVDSKGSFEEIAKKLRVKYLLTSSIHKKEDGFDLHCQLIEAESGNSKYANKWSESIDKAPTIVGNLADNILKTLKVSTNQEITKISKVNVEAYEYYLRGRYQYKKQQTDENIAIAKELLREAVILDNKLIDAHIWLGKITQETGDQDIALEIFNKSLGISRELGDSLGVAASLMGIGDIQRSSGGMDSAITNLKYAFSIVEKIGDRRNIARLSEELCNCSIGTLMSDIEYLKYRERGFEISKELQDSVLMITELWNLADALEKMERDDKALDCYKQSLEISEDIRDNKLMGKTLRRIGNFYKDKEEFDKALDYFNRSFTIIKELGDKYEMGASLQNIGECYIDKEEYDNALNYFNRSLKIWREIGEEYLSGKLLLKISDLLDFKGEYDNALDYSIQSLEIFKQLGHKGWMGYSLNSIGRYYRHKGEIGKALDYNFRALNIFEELDDKRRIANNLFSIGVCYYYDTRNNYTLNQFKAVDYLEKSVKISKEIGLEARNLIWPTTFLFLLYNNLEIEYDINEIHRLTEETEKITYYHLNYALFQLLEDTSYLETAYNQVQEKASAMEEELKAKFLSYPIPKAIVEEWEKVK